MENTQKRQAGRPKLFDRLERINVLLPPDLLADLAREAASEAVSVSEIIRRRCWAQSPEKLVASN